MPQEPDPIWVCCEHCDTLFAPVDFPAICIRVKCPNCGQMTDYRMHSGDKQKL